MDSRRYSPQPQSPLNQQSQREESSDGQNAPVLRETGQETESDSAGGTDHVAITPLCRPLKRTSSGYILSPLIVDDHVLTEYYLHNVPDFSGIGLLDIGKFPIVAYRTIAARSPNNNVAQILIAESARSIYSSSLTSSRPLVPKERLATYKVCLLESMNRDLDRDSRRNLVSLVAPVVALSVQNIVHGDGREAEVHFQGIKSIVDRAGGLARLTSTDETFFVKNLLHYAESLAHYYFGHTQIFLDESFDINTNHDAANRFRLAAIPKHSGLSAAQKRNHHLLLFAGPEQAILRHYRKYETLCMTFFNLKLLSPIAARYAVQQFEGALLPVLQSTENWSLPSEEFSVQDRELSKQLILVGARAGILAIARFYVVLDGTDLSKMQQDHAVQALLMLHPWQLSEDDGPKDIAFWASVYAIALEQGFMRHHICPRLSALASELQLTSWESFKSFMQSIFYCEQVFDAVMEPLWREIAPIETDILTQHSASGSSPNPSSELTGIFDINAVERCPTETTLIEVRPADESDEITNLAEDIK